MRCETYFKIFVDYVSSENKTLDPNPEASLLFSLTISCIIEVENSHTQKIALIGPDDKSTKIFISVDLF